ncbi:hypothetical protein HKD37_12G034304 [Glycine soja]
MQENMQVLGAWVSTKGSNVETVVNASGEDVLLMSCLLWGYDVVKVSVEKVFDGDAQVLYPTSEIKYVRKTLDTFIAWPTQLGKLISYEDSHISPKLLAGPVQRSNDVATDDPLRDLIKSLYDIYEKPVEFMWNGTKFGILNVDASLFLTYSDVNEIISGDKCLNIAILQLWMMFLDEWCSSLGHGSVYGFLEPQSIHKAKDRCVECQHYIQTWVKDSQREVYLRAYLNQAHWQLIILCLGNDVGIWFCSLRRKLDIHIKAAVNNAMKTLKTTVDGKTDQVGPQWIEVKWFGDGTPLDIETITTIRKKWATYFVKVKNTKLRKV